MNGNKFNFFTAIFVDLNGCSKFQNLGMVVLKLQQSKKKPIFFLNRLKTIWITIQHLKTLFQVNI